MGKFKSWYFDQKERLDDPEETGPCDEEENAYRRNPVNHPSTRELDSLISRFSVPETASDQETCSS